jgi:hypothetical protein
MYPVQDGVGPLGALSGAPAGAQPGSFMSSVQLVLVIVIPVSFRSLHLPRVGASAARRLLLRERSSLAAADRNESRAKEAFLPDKAGRVADPPGALDVTAPRPSSWHAAVTARHGLANCRVRDTSRMLLLTAVYS